MENSAKVQQLLSQLTAIAEFGSFAFRQTELPAVVIEAARVCAAAFNASFCTVCRYRPTENDLVVEADWGWKPGVTGCVTGHPGENTPQWKVFTSGQPLTFNLLDERDQFTLPPFYAEHDIVSTFGVLIKGEGHPYGVLEIYSKEQQEYDQHDIDFLTSFANVLSEAVGTAERLRTLGTTIDRMRLLAADQDRLLDQKRVLAEELQHRVRNNLQLVHGMLSKQLDETDIRATQRGLKGIARRVFTLAQVYDQLLGTEMTRQLDFCGYVRSLCENLAEVQGPPDGSVRVECSCDRVMLDLDVVTSLGIVVAELVTNSFEHAFPTGGGEISVSLHLNDVTGTATMTVRDNGVGYTPQAESKRHGLGLIRRLIEQVGGSATVEGDHGTVWTVIFPVDVAAVTELTVQ